MTPTNNRHLTPDAMPLLANRLADTMGKIERWAGISISGSSRVAEAVRVLRSVAPSSAFSGSREDLTRVAHAVRDAQDFWVIGNMLGPQTLLPVVTALRHAIGGNLGQTPHPAYQAQSELWVGAMIAAAGTQIGVMSSSDETRPDFVLTEGTLQYSVEVKRPESLRRARQLVSGAAQQLLPDRFHGGALVVDLTDCLLPELVMHFAHGPPTPKFAFREHESLTTRLHQQIVDDSSLQILQQRRHIFGALSLARRTWWNLDDLSQLYSITQVLRIVYLTDGAMRKTLRYHRARWIAGLVGRGLQGVGVNNMGGGEVRFSRRQQVAPESLGCRSGDQSPCSRRFG